MPKLVILILSAGKSSRMGEPKQLLKIGNITLLGTVIQSAIHAQVDAVYCVLGAYASSIQKVTDKYPVKVLLNNNYESGLSSSIAMGIHKLTTYDAVLIMLSDQPNVDTKYLDQLITKFKEKPTNIIASRYGNKAGVPAIFPSAFYDDLLQLKGDKGARELLHNNERVIMIDHNDLIDIDTPEAYSKFLESRKEK